MDEKNGGSSIFDKVSKDTSEMCSLYLQMEEEIVWIPWARIQWNTLNSLSQNSIP